MDRIAQGLLKLSREFALKRTESSRKRETSLAKKWEEPSMHQTRFHYNGRKNQKGGGKGMPNIRHLPQKTQHAISKILDEQNQNRKRNEKRGRLTEEETGNKKW